MTQDLNTTIRLYLNRQLSDKDREAFEKRLAQDPVFAAAAAEETAFLAALEAEGDAHLERQLQALAQNLKNAPAAEKPAGMLRKIAPYTRLLYAAALAGLLVTAFFLLKQPGTLSPEAAYAAHFSIPPAPSATRDGAPVTWTAAYTRGDYRTVTAQLDTLLADPAFKGRSEAFLYAGISYLALQNPERALSCLRQVSPDSFDWESAQWYSALALLKLGRVAEAKTVLSGVAGQKTHPHRAAAERLVESL